MTVSAFSILQCPELINQEGNDLYDKVTTRPYITVYSAYSCIGRARKGPKV